MRPWYKEKPWEKIGHLGKSWKSINSSIKQKGFGSKFVTTEEELIYNVRFLVLKNLF